MAEIHFHDGDAHFDGDAESGDGREQADDQGNATKELGERRSVAKPVGKSHVSDHIGKVVERSPGNDFGPAVREDDGAEDGAGDERSDGPHSLKSRQQSVILRTVFVWNLSMASVRWPAKRGAGRFAEGRFGAGNRFGRN